jgi:flavin reductase (DIM6/NTAB) family NADH-FMN oxidoreductase RutF
MFFEPDKNDHGLPYNPIKACVVPRPIGWITTVNDAGKVNVAPFSFFNALSYNPPFCLFSAGGHADDEEDKDTVVNIKQTGEFVYNMATWDQREEMNQTGLIIDRNLNELSETGL